MAEEIREIKCSVCGHVLGPHQAGEICPTCGKIGTFLVRAVAPVKLEDTTAREKPVKIESTAVLEKEGPSIVPY